MPLANCNVTDLAIALAILCAASSCVQPAVVVSQAPPLQEAEPALPPPISMAPNSETCWNERLWDQEAFWAATGSGTALFVATPDGLAEYDMSYGLMPIALETDLNHPMLGLDITEEGTVLFATRSQLLTISESRASPSPLSALFESEPFHSLVVAHGHPDKPIWIGTATGLWRWQDGRLESLAIDTLPTMGPLLAYRPGDETTAAALWVASEELIYTVSDNETSFYATVEHRHCDARDLAIDSSQTVWARCKTGGVIYRVMGDTQWYPLQLPSEPTKLVTNSLAPHVWIVTEDQRLWHVTDKRLWGTDIILEDGTTHVDATGALLNASSSGINRIHPGRSIELVNLPLNNVVVADHTITIEPDASEHILSIQAFVGEQALDVVGRPWQFTLPALSLPEGDQVLRIRVTYDDVAQPAESFLPILVRHLSWDSDIQPIIADRCNGCHGATGAVALKLSNHTDWVTHIEAVVTAVETGLMPPGTPLERDHIDTIHYWRLAGFPE